ncbi:MAG TPA: ZIP family metal transporter [Bacillota bacterium]|nr:ZIP family metal transporter [Bacillota bacterium]
MNDMLLSVVVGSLAGIVGTGLGGALAFLLKHPTKRYLSTVLGFSAGLMISVVCFDLLPRAFETGGLTNGLVGALAGVIIMAILQDIFNRNKTGGGRLKRADKDYVKTGILLGIGIGLHNFPEGLAIGTGFTSMHTFGIGLSIVIALHDIPEGIAMATPMRIGGLARARVIIYSLLAGIPTGIGALVGYILGEISALFICLCLGFAGGAMLYITCSELIPESRDLYKGRISAMGLVAGMFAGILITNLF